jgi:hypothetical protein
MEFLAHLRKSRCQALRQRAQIVMASMVYTPVYQIALICQTDEAHVRRVIHTLNDYGFESLNPKVGTGRPQTFEPAIRERIVAVALAPPTTLGEPRTHWSLRRLKGYLERRRVVRSIAVETLRSILRARVGQRFRTPSRVQEAETVAEFLPPRAPDQIIPKRDRLRSWRDDRAGRCRRSWWGERPPVFLVHCRARDQVGSSSLAASARIEQVPVGGSGVGKQASKPTLADSCHGVSSSRTRMAR